MLRFIQSMRGFLRMLIFVVASVTFLSTVDAHAELSCDGFHALIDFIKKNQAYTFAPQDYAAQYDAGLAAAVQQFLPKSNLSAEQINRLKVAGDITAESYKTCADSERIVAAVKSQDDANDITLGDVLSYQVKGIVHSMDPHSDYLLAREWYGDNIAAASASLGIKVAYNNGHPVVTAVYPGGPAEAVLNVGDELQSVVDPEDGRNQSLQGMQRQELLQLLSGEDGDEFIFSIKRQNQIRQAVVAMSDTPGSAVAESKMLEAAVGYIKLIDFHQGAAADFAAALRTVADAKALIIDLRNNPGGRVQEAVEILDQLVDLGVAVSYVDHNGTVLPQKLSQPGLAIDVPIVVLMNRFSASAAEILLLGLHDHQRAVLEGENSFGKGTAQLTFSPESLQDTVDESIDGALRLTTYYYVGPQGVSPQRQRIAPHVMVSYEAQEKEWQAQQLEYARLGKVWISGESDFPSALPIFQLTTQFDAGTQPTNSIDNIIKKLTTYIRAKFLPGTVTKDPQLARAIEILQQYQGSCSSYHQQQCSFDDAQKVANAGPSL